MHDIDQHQAGQDFIGAEAVLEEGRNRGQGHAAQYAQHQHEQQTSAATAMSGKNTGTMAAEYSARRELALGADVPDIGEIGDAKPGADQRQRRGLDDQLLDRPVSRSAVR